MRREELPQLLGTTLEGFSEPRLPAGKAPKQGKVRDIFDLGDRMIICTTDRISAFDRVLSTIPAKGEVLNRISAMWFRRTEDIIPNHLIESVSPRSILVRTCRVIPVEVVVRGYLTGSAWRDYRAGRPVSGIDLPQGMRMNQKFDQPLITPSTKEEQGAHDQPISREEVVASGRVEKGLWEQIERAALGLFERGTKMAAERGLILVDTKYEFGLDADGALTLVDEIHTPDSSRYWYADTYEERFGAAEEQRVLDKEYLRRWLMDRGFSGDGEAPQIPDEVRVETAWRYIQAFQIITGEDFSPQAGDAEAERILLESVIRKT